LPVDQREYIATKQAAAFSNTGWDSDEDDTQEPDLPPVVEKPIDVSKGVPLRRWDVDNKGNLWPLVKVSRLAISRFGGIVTHVLSV
jgi:hypothetical protein